MGDNIQEELLELVQEAAKTNKVEINGREYTIDKANFRDCTKLAAFIPRFSDGDGMEWLGSDEFHDVIKPIVMRLVRYKSMLLNKHAGLEENPEFIADSLRLFIVAISTLSLPLVRGAE